MQPTTTYNVSEDVSIATLPSPNQPKEWLWHVITPDTTHKAEEHGEVLRILTEETDANHLDIVAAAEWMLHTSATAPLLPGLFQKDMMAKHLQSLMDR